MPRKTQIQIRRDTAANWTATNPVLAAGELGFETNTGKFKIGDGTTAWAALSYAGGGSGTISDLTSTGGSLAITNPTGPTTNAEVAASGVAAATYGDSTHVAQVAVGADGRVTSASSIAISGSGGAGGLIVLYDSGYLGGSAASIDTGAGGIASGHFCLHIIAYLRVDTAVGSDNVLATFNNDSSALYDWARVQTISSAVSDGAASLGTSALLGNCPGTSAAAHIFGSLVVTIPAYDGTTNYKQGSAVAGVAEDVTGNSNVSAIGFCYQSASAISRMKIVPGTAGKNFVAGSRLVVYGLQ